MSGIEQHDSFYFDRTPKKRPRDAIRRFIEKHFGKTAKVNSVLIRSTGTDGHYVTEVWEFDEQDPKKKKRNYFTVKGKENTSLVRTFGSRHRNRR